MTARFSFSVDGKPRGKGRPRTSPFGGRPYTPAKTVAAEKEIATLARVAMGPLKLMTGTVRLDIEAVFEVPRSWSAKLRQAALAGELEYTGKPDRDNIMKLVMDALNGVAWLDDAQVNKGPVVRRYGYPARTEVTVEELEAANGLKSPAERRREQKLASGMVAPKRRKKPRKAGSVACEELAIGKRIR